MKCPNCHQNGSRVVDSRPATMDMLFGAGGNVKIVVSVLLHLKE